MSGTSGGLVRRPLPDVFQRTLARSMWISDSLPSDLRAKLAATLVPWRANQAQKAAVIDGMAAALALVDLTHCAAASATQRKRLNRVRAAAAKLCEALEAAGVLPEALATLEAHALAPALTDIAGFRLSPRTPPQRGMAAVWWEVSHDAELAAAYAVCHLRPARDARPSNEYRRAIVRAAALEFERVTGKLPGTAKSGYFIEFISELSAWKRLPCKEAITVEVLKELKAQRAAAHRNRSAKPAHQSA